MPDDRFYYFYQKHRRGSLTPEEQKRAIVMGYEHLKHHAAMQDVMSWRETLKKIEILRKPVVEKVKKNIEEQLFD